MRAGTYAIKYSPNLEDVDGLYENWTDLAKDTQEVTYSPINSVDVKISYYDGGEISVRVSEGDVLYIVYRDVTDHNRLKEIVGQLKRLTTIQSKGVIAGTVNSPMTPSAGKTQCVLLVDCSTQFESQVVKMMLDDVRTISVVTLEEPEEEVDPEEPGPEDPEEGDPTEEEPEEPDPEEVDPEDPEEGDPEDPTPEDPEEEPEEPNPEDPEEVDPEEPGPEDPEEGDPEEPTPVDPEEPSDDLQMLDLAALGLSEEFDEVTYSPSSGELAFKSGDNVVTYTYEDPAEISDVTVNGLRTELNIVFTDDTVSVIDLLEVIDDLADGGSSKTGTVTTVDPETPEEPEKPEEPERPVDPNVQASPEEQDGDVIEIGPEDRSTGDSDGDSDDVIEIGPGDISTP
jgi:outer membrane biosynthesis protein TonB